MQEACQTLSKGVRYMPKLRFDRFMVTQTTNHIVTSNETRTVLETPNIVFVDMQYGFTHEVSEYNTKLNLQDKTYEISEEQKRQMDLAVITMKQLETDTLRNKDTVLYFTTLDKQYIITDKSKQHLLRIAVEGPHITLYGQAILSTKEHTVTEITQAVYQYLKQEYVLTRIPLDKSSYWKEQTKQI